MLVLATETQAVLWVGQPKCLVRHEGDQLPHSSYVETTIRPCPSFKCFYLLMASLANDSFTARRLRTLHPDEVATWQDLSLDY